MTTPILPRISDDHLDELVRECRTGADEHGGMGHDYDSCLIDRLGNALEQMQSSLRAAEADAKRYRWLRDTCGREWDVCNTDVHISIERPPIDDCADLDAVIDAAMERKP